MSLSASYTVGTAAYNITSGGNPSATQVITYAMSGDGSSVSFTQQVGGFGLGTPSSVAATITKQQITGVPPTWLKNNVYALNTVVQANGYLQKVTTAGTSMPGWVANATITLNQTICDNAGNMQIATVGGSAGTSYPGNFASGMLVGSLTQDNGVTWQCVANICPNFSNVTNATTTDNTVVWTCQGADAVVPTYDAPGVTPTLSGSTLTLTFNEALKAPGATNTDAYGTVFTYTAWVVTVTLTFSAINNDAVQSQSVTWTSATPLNTSDVVACNGAATITLCATTSGTLTAGGANMYVSLDGTNWFSINASTPYSFGIISGWGYNSGPLIYQFQVSGYNYWRVQLTTALVGSGSATFTTQTSNLFVGGLVTIGQPFGSSLDMNIADPSNTASANVTAKGTQGTSALAVQEFKDSSRTPVILYLDSLSGIVTEALATMNINKGGTTSTATSYTVTAGKTFRVQSVSLSVVNPTTTNVAARLRLRSAATVAASSPVFVAMAVSTQGAATAFAGGVEDFSIPDGLEFAGGVQVGLSHIESSTVAGSTTTGAGVSACVIGFEY